MSNTGTPSGLRLRRPSWKDPRLLLGVLLVLASIAGVVGLVRAAETTIVVYAAKDDIPVGQSVSLEQLVDAEKLPQLLGAQANKAKVSVVWNPSGRAR